jgi:hypothetical protein
MTLKANRSEPTGKRCFADTAGSGAADPCTYRHIAASHDCVHLRWPAGYQGQAESEREQDQRRTRASRLYV